MKITPTVEKLAAGVESWAQDAGWKTVSVKFADEYQRQGGGKLIPPATDERGIRNAIQRVKRIFSLSGPRYTHMADALVHVALAAMPKRRRIELEEPHSPDLATAKAIEAWSAAMSALAIRCPSAMIKLNKAADAIQTLIPIAETLLSV